MKLKTVYSKKVKVPEREEKRCAVYCAGWVPFGAGKGKRCAVYCAGLVPSFTFSLLDLLHAGLTRARGLRLRALGVPVLFVFVWPFWLTAQAWVFAALWEGGLWWTPWEVLWGALSVPGCVHAVLALVLGNFQG